jgi:hypothetical protein
MALETVVDQDLEAAHERHREPLDLAVIVRDPDLAGRNHTGAIDTANS